MMSSADTVILTDADVAKCVWSDEYILSYLQNAWGKRTKKEGMPPPEKPARKAKTSRKLKVTPNLTAVPEWAPRAAPQMPTKASPRISSVSNNGEQRRVIGAASVPNSASRMPKIPAAGYPVMQSHQPGVAYPAAYSPFIVAPIPRTVMLGQPGAVAPQTAPPSLSYPVALGSDGPSWGQQQIRSVGSSAMQSPVYPVSRRFTPSLPATSERPEVRMMSDVDTAILTDADVAKCVWSDEEIIAYLKNIGGGKAKTSRKRKATPSLAAAPKRAQTAAPHMATEAARSTTAPRSSSVPNDGEQRQIGDAASAPNSAPRTPANPGSPVWRRRERVERPQAVRPKFDLNRYLNSITNEGALIFARAWDMWVPNAVGSTLESNTVPDASDS